MSIRLAQITAQRYASAVLPLTHSVWGGTRTLASYVEQNLITANSPQGRRFFRTFGVFEGDEPLSSFKRYESQARAGKHRLRAFGIGAVFTPPAHRGAGNASAMLAMALDAGRAQGFDFAYLYSDIHPQFYKQLGFTELPSRAISLRADSLCGDRVKSAPVAAGDWRGLQSCFNTMESAREFALLRGPLAWSLLKRRQEGADNLLVHRGKDVGAYVLGRREPAHDAYVVNEFGYRAEGADLIGPLLRSAAGDLRRIVGWLPPLPARSLLPKGAVRRRPEAIFMIAPLSAGGAAFLECAGNCGAGDPVWNADHV